MVGKSTVISNPSQLLVQVMESTLLITTLGFGLYSLWLKVVTSIFIVDFSSWW